MEFFVATHSCLLKCKADLPNGNLEVRKLDNRHCYGMTRRPNGDFIFCFKELFILGDGRMHADTGGLLEMWDPTLSHRYYNTDDIVEKFVVDSDGKKKAKSISRNLKNYSLPWYGYDLHDITYDHNGLYICDPARNHLIFIRDDGNLVPGVFGGLTYSEIIFNNTAYDTSHPNTVVTQPGGQIAILLHNRGDKESEVAFAMNIDDTISYSDERLPLKHFGAHDMFFADNCITYNASEQGSVVKMRVDTHEVVAETPLDETYCKGMMTTADYIIIGTSEFVNFHHRFTSRSKLVVLTHDLEVIGGWELGPVGQVNSIMGYEPVPSTKVASAAC